MTEQMGAIREPPTRDSDGCCKCPPGYNKRVPSSFKVWPGSFNECQLINPCDACDVYMKF